MTTSKVPPLINMEWTNSSKNHIEGGFVGGVTQKVIELTNLGFDETNIEAVSDLSGGESKDGQ